MTGQKTGLWSSPSQGRLPHKDAWQCLGTFLVVTAWEILLLVFSR